MRSSVSPRGRVAGAAGSGDAGRSSSGGALASGRAAAGTAVITMSARAAAGGRRVGTGSVARSARVDSARRAPGPAAAGRAAEPAAGRSGVGEEVVDEASPRRDIVGRTGPVGPRPAAQARAAPVAQQDVRGVEPAVHDAEVVQVGERRGHRGGDAADVGDRAGPPGERLAGVGGAQLAGWGPGLPALGARRRLEVATGHERHHPRVAGVGQAGGLVAQPVDGVSAGGGLDRDQDVAVEVDRDVHVHATKNADKH